MKSAIGGAVLCLFMLGCSTQDYSKNMKCATAQASAIVASKVILDQVSAEKYDTVKATLTQIVNTTNDFIDSGKISSLPLDQAKASVSSFMISKGWGQYAYLLDATFAYLASQQVDTTVVSSALGEDNVLFIKYTLKAIALSVDTSKKEWRPVVTTTK